MLFSKRTSFIHKQWMNEWNLCIIGFIFAIGAVLKLRVRSTRRRSQQCVGGSGAGARGGASLVAPPSVTLWLPTVNASGKNFQVIFLNSNITLSNRASYRDKNNAFIFPGKRHIRHALSRKLLLPSNLRNTRDERVLVQLHQETFQARQEQGGGTAQHLQCVHWRGAKR